MHLRWSITNPYLIVDGGPTRPPIPPNTCRVPGTPVARLGLALLEQDVPPDPDAGQHDHDEQYALECPARETVAGEGAELGPRHRAQRHDHSERDWHLAGGELADDTGGSGEGGHGERAADGHPDRHAHDD